MVFKTSQEKSKNDTEKIGKEFSGSFEFIKDVLIFGGFILAFLFNFFYIAVEKDLAVKDAYLVVKHRHLMTQEEILNALHIIFENTSPATPQMTRLALCADDIELIYLEREAKEKVLIKVRELLQKKFATDKDWEKVFVSKFSRSKIPFATPNIERFILYYSWAIEILSIILLSQTIQKKHIQTFVFECIHKVKYFFPVVGFTLFIPFLQFVFLIAGRKYHFLLLLLISVSITFIVTLFLYILAKKTLNEQKEITELGLYIFISAIFMQLLAISGDVDMVYDTFSNPFISYGVYASWFILATLPLLLIEKMAKARKRKK